MRGATLAVVVVLVASAVVVVVDMRMMLILKISKNKRENGNLQSYSGQRQDGSSRIFLTSDVWILSTVNCQLSMRKNDNNPFTAMPNAKCQMPNAKRKIQIRIAPMPPISPSGMNDVLAKM
jgi:hypothetical protein